MSEHDERVQRVFDKVIDAGIYPENWYMCEALAAAEIDGVISGSEYDMAYDAIQEYIGPNLTTRAALFSNGLTDIEWDTQAWADSEGVAFYRNWADRPRLTHADE